MKKYISIVLLMSILLTLFIPTTSKALTLTDIFSGGDQFLEDASGSAIFNKDNEEDAINILYWIMLGIAVAVAVIVGMVMGIQFITAGVNGQAKIKEKLIPFAVGCVVAFGAFGIWKLVLNILDSTF